MNRGKYAYRGLWVKYASVKSSGVSKITPVRSKNLRIIVSVFLSTLQLTTLLLEKFRLRLQCHTLSVLSWIHWVISMSRNQGVVYILLPLGWWFKWCVCVTNTMRHAIIMNSNRCLHITNCRVIVCVCSVCVSHKLIAVPHYYTLKRSSTIHEL